MAESILAGNDAIPPPPALLEGVDKWNRDDVNHRGQVIQIRGFAFSNGSFQRYIFDSPIIFTRCSFPDGTNFEDANFLKNVSFEECEFVGAVRFYGMRLQNNASFAGCTFRGPVDMEGISVPGTLELDGIHAFQRFWLHVQNAGQTLHSRNAKFNAESRFRGPWSEVDFFESKFGAHAIFSGFSVERLAGFGGAEFHDVTMRECLFKGGLDLGAGICTGNSDLTNCELQECFNCVGREFRGDFMLSGPNQTLPKALFVASRFHAQAIFSGRTFVGETSFRFATFSVAPAFHNCTLFPSTDFYGSQFQDFTSDTAEACYRSLRHCAKDIEAFHDELRFFTYEMRARRESQPNRAVRGAYRLYEFSSNYGLSVRRPFMLFLGVQLMAALIYWSLSNAAQFGALTCPSWHGCRFDWQRVQQLFSYTLSQALPFPAVKDAPISELWDEPGKLRLAVQFVAILHGLMSVVLLFLVGLGIRNLFRLK